MLDDLVNVIETLQQRIRDHGATLRENETRTRMALIDPLLTALGWDVSDPALVTPEYNVSGRWADYALLFPDGEPVATVEAKKLGESLASHRMQMLNYSNASGVEYAGLTDGDHWELYEVFQRGQLEDRRILDVSISGMLAHELALKMLLLWRPNLASGQPVVASEPILPVPEVAPGPEPTPAPPKPRPAVPSPEEKNWSTLDSFIQQNPTKQPVLIRFPDGSQPTVVRWYDLFTLTARWLWTSGKLTYENVPVTSRGKRNNNLLALQGQALNSNKSLSATNIDGTPLWFDRQGGGQDFRQRTLVLLAHCGVSPDTVHVQVGE